MNVTQGFLEEYTAEAASYYGFKGTPVLESGIIKTIDYMKKTYPDYFTADIIALLPTQLPGIVGGYPHGTRLEHGIDSLMIILMLAVLCGHGYIFVRNTLLGHKFAPSLAIMGHCIFAIVGWGARIAWSRDILNFRLSIVSYIFILVTEYLLAAVNLHFSRRLFAFQHPERRHRGVFPWLMLALGFASFVISILGVVLPHVNYYDKSQWVQIEKLQLASAITGVIFHFSPVGLTAITFACKPHRPGSKGAKNKTFPALSQAYWIQNIKISSFFQPQPIDFNTVCVIPSKRAPTNGINELATSPMDNGPVMWKTVLCIIPAAFLFYGAALIRALATGFAINSDYTAEYPVSLHPVVTKVTWFPTGPAALWIFYGGCQVLVLIYWLVVRVDLRFYVPRKSYNPVVNYAGKGLV